MHANCPPPTNSSRAHIRTGPRHLAAAAVLALPLCSPAPAGDTTRVERTYTSAENFAPCFRDTSVDVTTAPGFVRLRKQDYIVHTRGNRLHDGTNGGTTFTPQLMGKKVFHLDHVAADRGDIYIFSRTTGKASLNGHPVQFGPFAHHGGWSHAEVDGALLVRGDNDLVFHEGFRLSQDQDTAPAHLSFVSRDGGQAWEPAEGGEFLVHLRLHRYPASGTLTSEVIDLANARGDTVLCPDLRVRQVTLTCRATEPPGAAVALEGRTGPTCRPDADWSDWRSSRTLRPARYVQWRATLTSRDHAVTPILSRVTVRAQVDPPTTPAELGFKLARAHNPRLARGTYPYRFQRPSPKLLRLRQEFGLDEVVSAGKTEWEQLLLLRNWVRRQWPCNDAGSGVRTWDAIEILGAPENQHGMCVHFATAFAQCAAALGFVSRPVILTSHFVADVWSADHGKWVLMDVESVQPEGFRKYGTAHYLDARSRRPLDAVQLHRALRRAIASGQAKVDDVIQIYSVDTDDGPHAVIEARRSPKELGIFRSFAYTPRNDYLDHLEPWEVSHGENHYHSDDYLWWRTEADEQIDAHYSRSTDRLEDVRWTVNTVHLIPTVIGPAGTIRMTMDTVTPNLSNFLWRVDGGDWQGLPGTGDDPDSRRATVDWPLHAGRNRFEAKTRNRFERDGSVSWLDVNYAAPTDATQSK